MVTWSWTQKVDMAFDAVQIFALGSALLRSSVSEMYVLLIFVAENDLCWEISFKIVRWTIL